MEHLPWEKAHLPMLDEARYAAWERELGRQVIEHRGRFWASLKRGFFQPVHLLARLSWQEATRPSALCWGFRARIDEADAWRADAGVPVHLLPEPESYDIARLAPRRRSQVRRALREVDVVALQAPGLLLEQGYRIAAEQHARTPEVPLPDPAAFRRWVESYFTPRRGLALAGLRQDRLLGFALAAAVDGAAYYQWVFVGDEGMPFNLSLGLFHAFASLAKGCAGIREVVNSLHAREDESLTEFKRRQGLEVVSLPARAWLAPGLERGLRYLEPHKAYRLTGRG
jgi:hypothetical protein